MPIPNNIKITPTVESSGGASPLINDGIFTAIISDINYISAEQNSFTGKPQLKFKFKITDGDYKDVELISWVSLTLNPGWEQGVPSHLYNIAKSVLRAEPDLDSDFYPNTLLGGIIRIFVETKTSKNGKQYSRITKYLPLTPGVIPNKKEVVDDEDIPLPPEPEQPDDVDVEDIPF